MNNQTQRILAPMLSLAAICLLGLTCQTPPSTPEKPTGPRTAQKGTPATFSTRTIEPSGLLVSYQFDWGDRNLSSWTPLGAHDSTVSDTHTYTTTGTMIVRARAKNSKGAISNWSDTLMVPVIAGESTLKWVYMFYDISNEDSVVFSGTVALSADGKTVYAISDMGYTHFIDAASGKRLVRPFQYPDAESDPISSPSVADDGRALVCYDVPRLYSVQPGGLVTWQYQLADEMTGSPAVDAQGRIFFNADDGYLHVLNSTGGEYWAAKRTGGGPSSPAISADGLILFVGGQDSLFRALKLSDGSLLWGPIATQGPITGSPAIASDGRVCFGSEDGKLRLVSPTTGNVVMTYDCGAALAASPIIGPEGTIYVTDEKGVLHAVNPSTGHARWTKPLGCMEPSTAALTAQGVLYLVASYAGGDDSLVALNSTDGSRRWAVELPGTGDLPRCPVIAPDGSVIVTTSSAVLSFWGCGEPAASAWPMYQHDGQHTGRAR
ncbi:MAG: PQQ-binding-like beta-propeller repeat protein [candidate division WOR-3 bacterium]